MDQEDALHRLLLSNLSLEKFEQSWLEDVSNPEDEVCVATHYWKLPKRGKSTVFLLASGLTVVCDQKEKWSAYESAARCAEREYFASWARFCRGTWTARVPQSEGVFPTRTLEGHRGRDRTLRRCEGRLMDVTVGGGFVGYGMISEWRGEWFSDAYPPLKGAI